MDEERLTADALWEAVTGKPGAQTWYESVHITCRSPEAEAARKAENERIYAPRRERAEKAKTELATEAQVKYLITLAEKVGKERFDAEFAKVIRGSDIAPRAPAALRDGREAADQRQGPQAHHRPGRPRLSSTDFRTRVGTAGPDRPVRSRS
ncbi:hypothetical protein [Streptomyces alfalfae]|uniref:hypothetical protein n=1 Tax=Streptomyces alfalfae TaxID=1642299 RepID=UPI002811DC5B|nr:hypothetical protein [Streptomyces alfalfae]